MQGIRLFTGLVLALCLGLLLPTNSDAQEGVVTQTRERIAVVRGQGGTLLDVQTQQPTATLSPGALLLVTGRSVDGRFFLVQTEALSTGWVASNAVLVVNVASVPVVDKPSAPLTGTVTLSATTPLTSVSPVLANPPAAEDLAVTALVTTDAGRLNLRAGPGVDYPVIAKAAAGSTWLVGGRNPAGDWVQLRPLTGGDAAWAATSFLQLSAPAADLPVQVVAVLLPTPTPDGAGEPLVVLPTVTPAVDAVAAPNPVAAARSGRMGQTGLAGHLVFQDRIGGTIYVYDLGTDTLRPLTSGIDPAISPDGQRVAFARDGGDHGLYVINLDGSNEQRIYNERELIRSPKWSPDSQLVVFSRSRGFQDCRLLNGGVCLPDATIIEALPPELQVPDIRVAKLIKDLPNQREYSFVLSRIRADGTDYRDVPSLTSAGAPDWGETGIVYHSRAGIQTTADQPDTRSFEVVNDPLQGYFLDPDWQPGGGRIVFHRKQGSHWQIYAVNPDGSGLVALTRPVTALVDELPSNVAPAWSPDGRTIIYLSNRSSIESAGAWHLWAMAADGSNQRRLPIDVIFDYTFSSEQVVSWAAAP